MTDRELTLVRRTEAGTAICRDDDGRDVVVNEVWVDWADVRARNAAELREMMARPPAPEVKRVRVR